MEVLQRTANRGSVSTGFDIDNSLKLEADNSETLSKTFSSDGNKQTWTVSFWVKRTELSTDQMVFSAGDTYFYFLTSDVVRINTRGATNYFFDTSAVFRDTSAWYHFVVRVDTTNSTAADRTRLYVNGVEFSSSTTSYENNTGNTGWNDSAKTHVIGNYTSGSYHLCGYLAEFHSIDGQSLAPTDFGEYDEDSGIWKPKAYTGSYGTNGFYLDFENSGSLGADGSGNGNNFTLNNITSADQALDTPTNNFAIISNAMRDNSELSYSTVSDGGSLFRTTVTEKWVTSVSSIGVTKGKWYAEFNVIGSRPNNWWGIASMEQLNNNSGYSSTGSRLGESGKNWSIGYYQANGKLDEQQNSGYTTTSSWGSVVSQNQIVGVALDMDNHKLYMSVNNVYQNSGNPVTGANAITFDDTETVAIANTGYSLGGGNDTITGYNFGGYRTGGLPSQATDENGYGAFRYAPPSGYYALCTKNLAEYG